MFGITKRLIWAIKEQNLQTLVLPPIFALMLSSGMNIGETVLVRCLARDRKCPPQRRNRSSIFSGES